MNPIEVFLRDRVAEPCEAPSYTGMIGGSWLILKSEEEEFFRLYLDSLRNGGAHHFSERIMPGCKFYFFLDLDFPSEETVETIVVHNGLDTVVDFYRILVTLAKAVARSITENNIDVIFSKKIDQTHKLHLNFPTALCDRSEIAIRAIKELQRSFIERFNTATCPALQLNWGKVFDSQPYHGGLRMPGSRKAAGDGPESAYEIFDLDTEEFEPLTVDLLQRTSIRSEVRSSLQAVPGVQYGGGDGEVPFNVIRDYVVHLRAERTFGDLPLSIHLVVPAPDGVSFYVKLNDRACPFKGALHRRQSRVLYLVISPTGCRLKCYAERCKHAPSPPHPLTPEMRAVFDGLAPLTLKVSETERAYFETFDMRMRLSDETRALMKDLQATDLQLAEVFYSIFKERFCVTVHGKDAVSWFVFLEHRFHPGDMKAKLALMYVVRTLYKLYIHESYPDTYRSENAPAWVAPVVAEDEGLQEDGGEGAAEAEADQRNLELIKKIRVKKATAIVNRLEMMKTVVQILNVAGILFGDRNPGVADKLDSARHLMAFENGVLDFSVNSQPIFRPGRFTDYITLHSPVEFKYFNIHDPILAEVVGFFVSLFPKVDIREYILKVLSKCLTASEIERLYILTGSGSNGKTKLIKLITKSFGDYWRDMNVSVLTQKRKSSNAASPELVDLKGRHVVTTQEPDADVKLNSGVVKQATGGDPLSVRQLYGAQFVFYPKATILLCCNDVPAANSCDGGMIRRQRVIPLDQKFVAEPNPNRPHEQRIDDNLDRKIEGWGSAFCYLLYLYRIEHPSPQIEECEAVLSYTRELARESDHFYAFEAEYLVPLTAEEELDRDNHTTFDRIWGLYESFCTVHKFKKVGRHSLKRRLHEKYGTDVRDDIQNVIVRVVGEQVHAANAAPVI